MKKEGKKVQTSLGMVTAEELALTKKAVAMTQLFIDGTGDIESGVSKQVARGKTRLAKAFVQMEASGNESLIESARKGREKHGIPAAQ